MYGLGVRIGMYIQLVTTIIVDLFVHPRDAADLVQINLWFLMAVFVAAQARRVLSPGSNLAEAFIVVSMDNGINLTLLTGTLRLELRETCLAALVGLFLGHCGKRVVFGSGG